jgi:hypothetical protein
MLYDPKQQTPGCNDTSGAQSSVAGIPIPPEQITQAINIPALRRSLLFKMKVAASAAIPRNKAVGIQHCLGSSAEPEMGCSGSLALLTLHV